MKNLLSLVLALRPSKPIAVIPAAFLCGMAFCMGCDLIAPTELSISTVTSVFGAPVVIGMMLKRRRVR